MHDKLHLFTELYALGMNPIPVIWDLDTKQVLAHPNHQTEITDGKPTLPDVEKWLNNGFKHFNGIALKLYPPFGMLDFDIKNSPNKNLYNEWLTIVNSTNPDILRKVCIETTRSAGYHVYIRYSKLDHKIPVARSEKGEETISVYTGGLLSYCSPSPNYAIIHNDFADLEELTDDEYEFLVATAALFNEDKQTLSGESKVAVIDYPVEYENICLQFDNKCSDDTFEQLLNSIDLYRAPKQPHKKNWVAFLRSGSSAVYSAKVYFYSRRLLIFSGSMSKFPTWHDSAKSGDNTWSLSPSKIVFYKNNKSWTSTIEEIQMICDSAAIDIIVPDVAKTPLLNEDRLRFPYDIYPECVQNYIQYADIQAEYVAGFILSSITTAIGNAAVLRAKTNYFVKPILYMAVASPAGGGKSPALSLAFAPLYEHQKIIMADNAERRIQYEKDLDYWEKNKKNTELEKPVEPVFNQIIIQDSTIEMVIKILSENPKGCSLVADELTGFMNRMNQYKSGDDVQKWLELWNGSPVMIQRVSRGTDMVNEPICNIAGGIQISMLPELSKDANEYNGFFHRFLFVYPNPQPKPDWETPPMPEIVKQDFYSYMGRLLALRNRDKLVYKMSQEAEKLYARWYNYKNLKYNIANSDQVKGIIAKYQNYCLRLALIIQLLNEVEDRKGIVSEVSMEKAIRLTEYFLGNMYKAIPILTPENALDGLISPYREFYDMLPHSFTVKTACETGLKLKIKENTVKTFIYRKGKHLFTLIEKGTYEKLY